MIISKEKLITKPLFFQQDDCNLLIKILSRFNDIFLFIVKTID